MTKYFYDIKDRNFDYSVSPLSFFKDNLHEENNYIAFLNEMEIDIGGPMWCAESGEFEDDCGLHCDYYNPCNGISGRCRKLKNGFKETGRKFEL